MRPILLQGTLAVALLCTLGAAADENCPSMFSGGSTVPWFHWREFFAKQSFGTVGFARNGRTVVYVPNPEVTCVTLPPGTSTVYVVFNHRNTDETDVGYVSFKVYGLLAHAPPRAALKMFRSGDWMRDNIALENPFDPPVYSAVYPGRIPAYESYYHEQGPTIGDFDRAFGKLHGVPKGSREVSSWDGRIGMQPDQIPDNVSVGYVMHVLTRVETQAGVRAPGDPPFMETNQLDHYRDLLVSVSSPLGEGPSRTLRFRE